MDEEEKCILNKKQIRQYIFVIKELTGREIKRRYSRSYLGIFWSVLNPLLSMAVMTAIFAQMFHRAIDNFPVYYLTGNIIWQLFTNATNSAMTALVDNKALLIKVKLPMQVFPLSRVYTAVVNFAYSFVAYFLILFVIGIPLKPTNILIIPVVLLTVIFSIGVSMFLSTLYVFFGDIKHLYGIVLTLLMYLSALFYPVSSLSGITAKVVQENPVYCYIAAARDCMMHGNIPSIGLWIRMIVWAIAMFVLGQLFFKVMKNEITNEIC